MRISDWSSDVCSSDLIDMRITSFDGEITLLEFWEPSAFRTSEHSLTFLRSMKSNLINNMDPKTLTSHINILRIIAQATVELVLARYAQLYRDRKSTRLNSSH